MTDRQMIGKLVTAVTFYANPDTYFAIGFFPDKPCGGFLDDFSEDHGSENYDRAMPGKLARQTLSEIVLSRHGT